MKPLSSLPAFLLFTTSCALQAGAQAPLIADVHPAPYRASINFTVNVGKERLDIHNATVVNLIDFSNGRADDDGRDDADITGGPAWLDFDRFDVAVVLPVMKAGLGDPPHPTPDRSEQMRALIRRVLQERFHLTSHTAERPLPSYLVTAIKGNVKLAKAQDQTAAGDCKSTDDKSAHETDMVCTSESIADLLHSLTPDFKYPLIDRTGLTEKYDFTLKIEAGHESVRADYVQALTDAFAKLGLAISLGSSAQKALVIDSADRPTPTPPEIMKRIAALPDMEFEVASVRRANEQEERSAVKPAGSQIIFSNFSMQELLVMAWQLPTGAMLGDPPQWLDHKRFTIRAKLPGGEGAHAAFDDKDEVALMLRKLLIERFQIKYHWGEHELDGWVIAGGTPKMKRADPASRTFCKYGPTRGEKDMRGGGSEFNGEFHCQNVTMAQLADLLQPMARSEIKSRARDKSGIAGSYDFSVYYTSARKLMQDARPDAASDQPYGYGLEDAFRKQLGLKLVKQRGSYPALILDHIEEFPTEN